MKTILEFLSSNGGMLLVGVSAVLALGVLLVLVQRQPIRRQRVAEGTMVACLVWLVLACVPLRRFSFPVENKRPAPSRTLEMYEPQAGDEVIAAEVFKVKKEQMPQTSMGIGVPLPMSPMPSIQATKAGSKLNWALIVTRIYVCGVILCALYMLLGHLLLRRLVRRSRAIEVAGDLRARVRICEDCDRPISFGLWRSTILLPAGFVELDGAKQQHILKHELAHVRQRDAVGHFLFNVMFLVLYFHPLYWLLRRKTNLARELIADDVAAGGARESYVADLLALARERVGHAALATHALGLFGSNTDLYRRMHMLMQNSGALERRCSNLWRVGYSTVLGVALMMMVGTMGVRKAAAQAAGEPATVDKRNAQEQVTAANEQEAEVAKLRAQQEQILAQLKALEVERRQLQDELAARKGEGRGGDEAVTEYKRKVAQREQAVAKEQEAAARDALARKGVGRPQEFGPDGDFAMEEKAKDEKANADRAAMRDWMNKKNHGAGDPNEAVGRAQLDLVALADRYVDAVGNLQMAQVELDELTGIAGPDSKEMRSKGPMLKVKVATAQRKVAIFRGIAQAALQSAKSDLQVATEQVKMGLAPTNAVNEPQSRLKILEVILAQ